MTLGQQNNNLKNQPSILNFSSIFLNSSRVSQITYAADRRTYVIIEQLWWQKWIFF